MKWMLLPLLIIAFGFGYMAAKAIDERTSSAKTPASAEKPIKMSDVQEEIVAEFARITKKPVSKMNGDDRKFFDGAMHEYQSQCMVVVEKENIAFCKKFREALVKNNDVNREEGLSSLLKNG